MSDFNYFHNTSIAKRLSCDLKTKPFLCYPIELKLSWIYSVKSNQKAKTTLLAWLEAFFRIRCRILILSVNGYYWHKFYFTNDHFLKFYHFPWNFIIFYQVGLSLLIYIRKVEKLNIFLQIVMIVPYRELRKCEKNYRL